MRELKVFIVLVCFTSLSFAQGAWVKPKGEVYTQLAYNDISDYDRLFNKDGEDLYASRRISDRTIQWYTEYGLTNKLTLVASVPFKLLSTGEAVPERTFPLTIKEGNLSAFGNIQLGARYPLLQKKVNIATQFQIGLPTGTYDNDTGLRSGIDSWTFNPSLAIGKGGKNWFVQSHVGLFLRTNDYSNGAKIYAEGGVKFFNRLWAIAFVDIVDSFEDGSFREPIRNFETFTNLNDSEYGGFGMKFIGEVTDSFGLTGAFGGAFSAHLEAHQASLNFGVYYKFKKKDK